MKYLIAGLGNFGIEYRQTRHNIGFLALDTLAEANSLNFQSKRYGDIAEYRYKGRTFILLKPSTYMNLSGNAIRYWLKKEKISDDRLLVVTDDMALEPGQIRLRKQGGDGGHNGLKHIIEILGHTAFARLRMGIGKADGIADQTLHVLGEWTSEEKEWLPAACKQAVDMIQSFGTIGIERTMNAYNKKGG